MFITKAVVLALATVAAAGVVERGSRHGRKDGDISVTAAQQACKNEQKELNCCQSNGDGGDSVIGNILDGSGCSPVVALIGAFKDVCSGKAQCCQGKTVGLINADCTNLNLL